MTDTDLPHFKTLILEVEGPIAWLKFNRPAQANAFDLPMWDELPRALQWIGRNRTIRTLILSAEGKNYSAGIDLGVIEWLQSLTADPSRATRGREGVLDFIERAQAAFNAFEALPIPVISAIHGACVGGAVDMIAACDIRLCSSDARFCIKEVDVAVVPDVGTLQRLSRVIGFSKTAELSFTAETIDAQRALQLGLVSQVLQNRDDLYASARKIALCIAGKSPVTVRGIKRNLLFARDHSVADSLAFNAAWNAAMLVGEDLQESLQARSEGRKPQYPD